MAVSEAFVSEVRRELDNIDNPRSSLFRNIAILAVTLVLFAAVGIFDRSPLSLAVLVLVLILHETGHLVGMKIFGYRDVKMFFIPFFGAAVSGRSDAPHGARDALVSLLGPAPGVVIGLGLLIAGLRTAEPRLEGAGLTFLFINGFNLLPFQPLDGGRIWNALVFGRHPVLETGFRVLTGLALAATAVWLKAWLLAGLAGLLLLGAPAVHTLAVVARDVRRRGLPRRNGAGSADGEAEAADDDAAVAGHVDAGAEAPDTLADEVALLCERVTMQADNAKVVAQRVHDLRRRVKETRASWKATLGLLGLYTVTVVIALASVVIAVAARME